MYLSTWMLFVVALSLADFVQSIIPEDSSITLDTGLSLAEVKIYYYSAPGTSAVQLQNADISTVNVDNTKEVKIIIHGALTDSNNEWYPLIVNGYLAKGCQVIAVDWGAYAYNLLLFVSKIGDVGNLVGQTILDMHNSRNVPLNKFHIIGHSLGAHIAGYGDLPSRPNDKFSNPPYPYVASQGGNGIGTEYPEGRLPPDHMRRCVERLDGALQEMRRRQQAKQKSLRLGGYSLHQQLRSAPYEMLVTDMRVRLPSSSGWVRVDRCFFDPVNSTLDTRLLFNDLSIVGRVNLFGDGELLRREPEQADPEGSCNMILRLRRAGIGFHTEPIRRERGHFNVRTDSHFLEPGFISVYAYGCEPHFREHRRSFGAEFEDEDIAREMEDIFIKGIRSLLTTYMQKELQPAIKETLMTSMGYTISYG